VVIPLDLNADMLEAGADALRPNNNGLVVPALLKFILLSVLTDIT
jgi:hypothetical protein